MSYTPDGQELSSEEIYGIAKKINLQLEPFKLHTHSAIIEMVRVGLQHRQLDCERQNKTKMDDERARALTLQEQHTQLQMHEMQLQQRQQAERAAAITGSVVEQAQGKPQ